MRAYIQIPEECENNIIRTACETCKFNNQTLLMRRFHRLPCISWEISSVFMYAIIRDTLKYAATLQLVCSCAMVRRLHVFTKTSAPSTLYIQVAKGINDKGWGKKSGPTTCVIEFDIAKMLRMSSLFLKKCTWNKEHKEENRQTGLPLFLASFVVRCSKHQDDLSPTHPTTHPTLPN